MHKIKITPLIRFLLILCIIVAGTAVNPQVVKADAKPGWIVSCTYSHSLNDDPIVFPGQVGVSHLHDFTGARTTNAFSTFTSLRAGGTTCAMPGDKSAYWVPALYEDGVRILPQAPSGNSVFYYRRIGAPVGTVVQPFPPGLRILIGNARAMSPPENPGLGTDIVFNCGPGEQGTPPLPAPPTHCDSGIMVLSLTFPNCWDGVNLDSADHRSHMSYPVHSRCPASHPVNLPRLESFFRYIVGTGPIGTITLASGPYYTAHQDFFNAWHPAALQTLVTNCINAGIDCGRNPSLPPGILSSTISGNAGVGGVSLSYTDVTARTVTSSGNGTYSLPVSDNWSGSVTPSHACFNFSPTSQNYSNIITNQTGQNYTPAFIPGSGCADIDVSIGGTDQGKFGILPQDSTRTSFARVNNGPVQIESTNAVPIMGAERLIYKVNGVNTSFSEMMGLPDSELDRIYWLPWYNNVDLDTQLRFGNVSGSTATVHVSIGGTEMSGSPFALDVGESTRVSFAGINNGPVEIVSDQNIVAAERLIYKVNGVNTSFSEMMGLPNSQLDGTYWLPWYNNVDLDTQLRFGNVSATTATVHVSIGGVEMPGSPFTLGVGESTRVSFAGVNNGPVKIESDQNIVAAERLIYKVNGVNTSFSEMMGLPDSQLDGTYWLPWYNNVDLDTQLRFGNVSGAEATVHVYIGGTEMVGSPFTLDAGASTRKSFAGINNGSVKIESNVNIVAAERVIYKVNGINTSFSEMMGLPAAQLGDIYWLPWYNNIDLDTQLRFGVP